MKFELFLAGIADKIKCHGSNRITALRTKDSMTSIWTLSQFILLSTFYAANPSDKETLCESKSLQYVSEA
jgi:hypothetical protein